MRLSPLRFEWLWKRNDIALVKLTNPVFGRSSLKLCSESYHTHTLAACSMEQFKNRLRKRPILQEIRLRETQFCFDSPFDNKKKICAVGEGRDTCKGDSGSPLYPLVDDSPLCLYGIVSHGSEHCTGVGFYTRVSAYLDWIQDVINGVGISEVKEAFDNYEEI